MCVCTVMSEEVAVHDVNQTVQLLLDQAARRNLEDELGEQLAVWRQKPGQRMKRKERRSADQVGFLNSSLTAVS